MIPGKKYVVQYGSTQQYNALGTKYRCVTVFRQGLSSETSLYREGRPIFKGVWVIDHSDFDKNKFFLHSRFIDIQPERVNIS